MTNFIYDNTSLPNWPKTNFALRSDVPSTQKIAAIDWNMTEQALVDIQTFLLGGAKLYKTGDITKHADVKVFDGSPSGTLSADKGSLCLDITNAVIYQNTDGATAWVKIGATTSGSLSIASAPATSVNVSTEGTLDWFAAPSNTHMKAGVGAWIFNSWRWFLAGNAFTFDSPTAGSRPGVTSTAADESTTTALASSTATNRAFTSAGPTSGWGFTFRVPALPTSRVLRVYFGQWSTVSTVRAHLTDGSAADVTLSVDSGASASVYKQITITFNSSVPCELVFSVVINSRYTVDPNIEFSAATLSTV